MRVVCHLARVNRRRNSKVIIEQINHSQHIKIYIKGFEQVPLLFAHSYFRCARLFFWFLAQIWYSKAFCIGFSFAARLSMLMSVIDFSIPSALNVLQLVTYRHIYTLFAIRYARWVTLINTSKKIIDTWDTKWNHIVAANEVKQRERRKNPFSKTWSNPRLQDFAFILFIWCVWVVDLPQNAKWTNKQTWHERTKAKKDGKKKKIQINKRTDQNI